MVHTPKQITSLQIPHHKRLTIAKRVSQTKFSRITSSSFSLIPITSLAAQPRPPRHHHLKHIQIWQTQAHEHIGTWTWSKVTIHTRGSNQISCVKQNTAAAMACCDLFSSVAWHTLAICTANGCTKSIQLLLGLVRMIDIEVQRLLLSLLYTCRSV